MNRHAMQIQGDGEESEGRGVTPAQEGSRETATGDGTQDTSVARVGRARDAVLYKPRPGPVDSGLPVATHGGGNQ